MKLYLGAVLIGLLLIPQPALLAAKGSHRPRAPKCASCPRTYRGRIARSESAHAQFLRQTGFLHGRPGYIVDHVVPLACGGADAPSNMQWQTAAEGKAKDKIERRGCGGRQ